MTDQVEHKGLLLFENGKRADVEIVRDHLTREIMGVGIRLLVLLKECGIVDSRMEC